ncbi:hypothetical protein HPB52_020098 [Rhipicephalus sanguineus]|uniref:Uncharacterized protein n=1 Tax=Rhipicephalus sanguineus TaxID=34632 RepID=A0A9D4Q748_RHISA|nr:hypothetical protein HPB52_020098 [Rhipicephalus sanguineus]
MSQQGDSSPPGPSGRPDSNNNAASFRSYSGNRRSQPSNKKPDSLHQYTFAKLKIMTRCPVPITDKERIEYLVQGIRDDQDQQAHTVDDFLSIASDMDRALDHARLIRSPQSRD